MDVGVFPHQKLEVFLFSNSGRGLLHLFVEPGKG